MSTRVTPEEYSTLTMVPLVNWKSYWRSCSALCDVESSHGNIVAFMQTEDHRAIALCDACYQHVLSIQHGS